MFFHPGMKVADGAPNVVSATLRACVLVHNGMGEAFLVRSHGAALHRAGFGRIVGSQCIARGSGSMHDPY